MDPVQILGLVNTGLVVVDKLIGAGKDIAPLMGAMKGVTAQNRPVTLADIEALETVIRAQSAELQAEPPPEEE